MGYGDARDLHALVAAVARAVEGAASRAARPASSARRACCGWRASDDPLTLATLATLARLGVRHERLDRAELERRWPQIDFGPITVGDPRAGERRADGAPRRAGAWSRTAVAAGVDYVAGGGRSARARAAVSARSTLRASRACAATFVFACGPWLPKLFPDLLGGRIFPTRQEVFYFGAPPGDARFASAGHAGVDRLRRGDLRHPRPRGPRASRSRSTATARPSIPTRTSG